MIIIAHVFTYLRNVLWDVDWLATCSQYHQFPDQCLNDNSDSMMLTVFSNSMSRDGIKKTHRRIASAYTRGLVFGSFIFPICQGCPWSRYAPTWWSQGRVLSPTVSRLRPRFGRPRTGSVGFGKFTFNHWMNPRMTPRLFTLAFASHPYPQSTIQPLSGFWSFLGRVYRVWCDSIHG